VFSPLEFPKKYWKFQPIPTLATTPTPVHPPAAVSKKNRPAPADPAPQLCRQGKSIHLDNHLPKGSAPLDLAALDLKLCF